MSETRKSLGSLLAIALCVLLACGAFTFAGCSSGDGGKAKEQEAESAEGASASGGESEAEPDGEADEAEESEPAKPHADAWAASPNGAVYLQAEPDTAVPAGATLSARSTTDDSFTIGFGDYDAVQVMALDMTYEEKIAYDKTDGSIKVSEGDPVTIAGVEMKTENRTWISAWVDDVIYYADFDGVTVAFTVQNDTYPAEIQELLEYAVQNLEVDTAYL